MQIAPARNISAPVTRSRCAVHGVVHKARPAAQAKRSDASWQAVIVDSHAIVRAGVRVLIRQLPELSSIDETDDGLAAVALISRSRPDLVIMDMDLPSLQGIDVIEAIVRRSPDTRVIVLSSYSDELQASLALRAGAHGYVLKQSCPETLMAALQSVQTERRCFVDPQLNTASFALTGNPIVIGNEPDRIDGASKNEGGMERPALASRERHVLKLIAEGASNVEIAEKLNIGRKTVETHRLNVMRKLAVHSTAELSCWAFRLGLTSL